MRVPRRVTVLDRLEQMSRPRRPSVVPTPLGGAVASETIASAATIAPSDGLVLARITGTTDIKTITPTSDGHQLILRFTGSLTVVNGSNLKIGANFVATPDDILTLVCDEGNWYRNAGAVN